MQTTQAVLNTSFLPRKNRKEQFEGFISLWSALIRSFQDQGYGVVICCLSLIMNTKLFLWLCPYFQIMVLSKHEICICVEIVTLRMKGIWH